MKMKITILTSFFFKEESPANALAYIFIFCFEFAHTGPTQ